MEKLYQQYKDVAEFRLIYIREAHAIDSNRPVAYAKEKGIKQQTNYQDRCTTAQLLIDDKSLTMPFLVDSMDNSTNTNYAAQPDRIFVVDEHGKIAVAAGRGPFGFKPGLVDAEKWLKAFKAENPPSDHAKGKSSEKKKAKEASDGKPKGESKDSSESEANKGK